MQEIAMDFITGLPVSHDYSIILVVIDRLSKLAHFIPLTHFSAAKVAYAFIKMMVSVHGIPKTEIRSSLANFGSKYMPVKESL